MSTTKSEVVHRAAAVAALVLSVVGTSCSDARSATEPSPLGPLQPSAVTADRGTRQSVNAQQILGTTPGWAEGKTVEFFYTQNFFCAEPPESGAPSKCEVGEDGQVDPIPNTTFPVLYVLTPQGFNPRETLHCPIPGSCVAHPSRIDLSRVLGPGASNVLLPAHSHVIEMIGDQPGETFDEAEFWELEVIGVKDPAVWRTIARARDLKTVRALQAAGKGITDDIPTNTYLFFGVRPHTEGTTAGSHP